MFSPILCLGQEWHVVCQRVRRVYPFLLWGILGMELFGFFGFSSVYCVLGGVLALLASLLHTRLGFLWCASCWTRLLDVVQWGHYLWNHGRECQAAHKIAFYYRLGIFSLIGSHIC